MIGDYRNLAIIYKARGDSDRAEELFRKSLELGIAVGSGDVVPTNR